MGTVYRYPRTDDTRVQIIPVVGALRRRIAREVLIIKYQRRWTLGLRGQETLVKAVSTLILGVGAIVILLPLVYMLGTALKSKGAGSAKPAQPHTHDACSY